MNRASRSTRLLAALLTLTAVAACGKADGADDTATAFCAAMEEVAARMTPDAGAAPDAVRANFDEVVEQLDEAEQNAPAPIVEDVTTYAAAIDDYVAALDEADYDLTVIFSTTEGTRLAEDTAHALTPDVIDHMTGTCGITLE